MNRIRYAALALACAIPQLAVAQSAQVHPEEWPAAHSAVKKDPAIEQRVEEILAKMTLEAKVGQVIQAEIREITPAEVGQYRIGSVLNGGGGFPHGEKYSSVADWLALADQLYDASMDVPEGEPRIPIIWGVDAVHGHNNVIGATLFPHNIGLGAANHPELLRQIGEVTAHEVRVTGLDWNFGPTVAVPRDDRWGRTYEGYSEAPAIVAAYAAAMVEGLQGAAGSDAFLDGHHLVATNKHFLGDGGTFGGKDQGDAQASESELREIHGAGYYAGIGAGVQTVMASFSSWQGRKLHGHEGLLTGVLRGRMGFDGFVVGDWNAHGQVEGCSNESCAAAFNAGVDMFMVPGDWKALYGNTLAQVRSGEIAAARLDEAVRNILRVKLRAGLFERGRPSEGPLAGREDLLGSPEHRAVARQAVRESLVLLKNAGGLLPLSRGQRVLVAGDGADDIGKQTGGWTISWQGTGNQKSDFPGATSIWDGIQAVVAAGGGVAVLSPDGSFSEKPDVAIVVYGEDPYAEFQGDRDHLDYSPGSDADLALLRELKGAGIPVVSVFISGRPMWVNPELNASDAFVAAWLPGSEGDGVAQVLFRKNDGSINHGFRGRLSFSWPKTPAQAVLNRGDADYDPLFAYGYGLSYGDDGDLGELSEESGLAGGADSRTVYFEGGPVTPWKLYLAEAGGREEVRSSPAASRSGNLVLRSVDRRIQEDAREAVWSGPASVVIAGFAPIDIERESNGALALAFDARLDEAPAGRVTLGMHCGDGCSGQLDATEAVAGLPPGEWRTLRFRLSCLARAGVDMKQVLAPFVLSSEGRLGLSFSDVRLVTEADGEILCPQ
jgi:beta-glucosidase